MLEGMRKAQQNWLGKIIITTLFSILIVSFAMVFVSPYLTVRQANTVITVGKTHVSFETWQSTYAAFQRQFEQRMGKPLTPRDAQALRLDQQALAQLISQTVLDESARRLGLTISDDVVAKRIFSMPEFQSALGFDRTALDSYLRNVSISEASFIAEQKGALMREQIGAGLNIGMTTPAPMQEFTFRLANEKRNVSYFTLTEANIDALPTPTDAQLEVTFRNHKSEFQAPEYRGFDALIVKPEALVKPESIAEEDMRKAYESLKATRYTTDERRNIQQIIFPSEQQAKDALARLKDKSVTFEQIAEELKLSPEALNIGNLTKKEMLDTKIADVAFALTQNEVSEIITGMLGPTVIRVTKIGATTYDDVKEEIRRQLASERSEKQAAKLRDDIEEMTANARPFSEIAQEKKLQLVQVKATDKDGRDPEGKPISDIPESQSLVQAAFSSNVGLDNAALSTKDGGYIWYQVTNVTPSRERTLNEVRAQVADVWKRNELNERLTKLASEKIAQIKSIEDLNKAAEDLKVTVKSAEQLSRRIAPPQDLGTEGFSRVFATPTGQPSSFGSGTNRVIFLVTSATVPPFKADDATITSLGDQFVLNLTTDMIIGFISHARKEYGVTVDQNAVNRLFNTGNDL